jgi:hypothetical protein
MKKILFIFIILFTTPSTSNEKIVTLATVNNASITNVDLKDELLILKILSNFKEIDKNKLQQFAFQNLLNRTIKEIEIISNKIDINKYVNSKEYNDTKKKLIDNGIKSLRIHSRILKKDQIDYGWKILISKKYSWKLNVNMNEIDEKLIALGYIDPNNPKTIITKNNFVTQEKNKKFNSYSRNHLDLAKKKLLIKIIK